MPFLDDLVASTKKRVSEAKELVNAEVFEQRISAASPARGFEHALSGPGVSLVGEIVRRGPHCRLLNPHMNVTDQARAYARGGACAVSVVTEPDFYEGSLEDLTKALAAELPLLRRDLIVDQFQVMESRAWRADAVVFLARAVGDGLRPLLSAARALRMDSLVEVHDERDLDTALEAGATLVGVNHLDLDTLAADPRRTEKLAPRVPPGVTLVSLMGTASRADVQAAGDAGAAGVIVGETLVTARDPASKVRELIGF